MKASTSDECDCWVVDQVLNTDPTGPTERPCATSTDRRHKADDDSSAQSRSCDVASSRIWRHCNFSATHISNLRQVDGASARHIRICCPDGTCPAYCIASSRDVPPPNRLAACRIVSQSCLDPGQFNAHETAANLPEDIFAQATSVVNAAYTRQRGSEEAISMCAAEV